MNRNRKLNHAEKKQMIRKYHLDGSLKSSVEAPVYKKFDVLHAADPNKATKRRSDKRKKYKLTMATD